jgi:urocanate hydratase
MAVSTRTSRVPRRPVIPCKEWPQAAALRAGAITADSGNTTRAQAARASVETAFDISDLVPEHVRPLPCKGEGLSRWVALSGDPDDIRVTDEAAVEMFAGDEALCRRFRTARKRAAFQGLSAGFCEAGDGDGARPAASRGARAPVRVAPSARRESGA